MVPITVLKEAGESQTVKIRRDVGCSESVKRYENSSNVPTTTPIYGLPHSISSQAKADIIGSNSAFGKFSLSPSNSHSPAKSQLDGSKVNVAESDIGNKEIEEDKQSVNYVQIDKPS